MIRVLVVDDSAFMRQAISSLLRASGEIEVIGTARDGVEAIEKVAELNPDVVTLDVEMPRLDGLEALKRIMVENPRPVIMLSSLTQVGAEATIQALLAGAVDFVPKPSGAISLDIEKVREDLIKKIRLAGKVPLRQLLRLRRTGTPGQGSEGREETRWPEGAGQLEPSTPGLARGNDDKARLTGSDKRPADRDGGPEGPANQVGGQTVEKGVGGVEKGVGPSPTLPGKTRPFRRVVVVGTSTGGPGALHEVIPRLPADLPAPVLVVQHMPVGFTRTLAERLNKLSALPVKEAEMGERLSAGQVLVAPGGYHLEVNKEGTVNLTQSRPQHGVRPAVDVTLESAVAAYGAACLAVIMTGMGFDGTRGAALVKKAGGTVIAEHESSCVIYGMPRAVVESGLADQVVPLEEIPRAIVANVMGA